MTRATPFLELAQLCRKVEATTKRNEKIALISTFLKSIGPEEVPLATLFLAGKAFPESDPRVLEISYATISDAGKNLGQSRLTEHQLTIRDVYDTLEKIAQTSGSKSRCWERCESESSKAFSWMQLLRHQESRET